MNHSQKSNSITLWLVNKSNKTDNADVMRIHMFALNFVGSKAATPNDVRNIEGYDELPFSIDDAVLKQLINHPCNPTI